MIAPEYLLDFLRRNVKEKKALAHQRRHPRAPNVPSVSNVSPDLLAQLTAPDLLPAHLQCANINVNKRRAEGALIFTKWWDYRFLHPAKATELFADAYVREFRDRWTKNRDRDEAEWKRPFCGTELFHNDPTTISGTWSARQRADELGIPYEFFIRSGLDVCIEGGYRKFPRPNQLLSNRVLATINVDWKKYFSANVRLPDAPQYLARNWQRHPLQELHIRRLLSNGQAGHRMNVATNVFQAKVMPEDRAVLEFGKEAVEDGRAHAKLFSADEDASGTPDEPNPVDLRPGCFGMPDVFDSASPQCGECPFKPACDQEQRVVGQIILEVYGVSDPHSNRKRQMNRERQRRRRERMVAAGG